ncbi:MAG: hypothetical protein R3F55_14785 [Alphaproteobacteria bacterium]
MEFLAREALTGLMVGSTHYVDIGQPKEAAIYYADAERAYMTLPDGRALAGDWHFTADGYHVAWTGGPRADWRIAFAPGRLAYVDAEGAERGTVVRIVPGDPEGFSRR